MSGSVEMFLMNFDLSSELNGKSGFDFCVVVVVSSSGLLISIFSSTCSKFDSCAASGAVWLASSSVDIVVDSWRMVLVTRRELRLRELKSSEKSFAGSIEFRVVRLRRAFLGGGISISSVSDILGLCFFYRVFGVLVAVEGFFFVSTSLSYCLVI